MSSNPNIESCFPYLAVGLAAFARKEFKYPYPPTLQMALNNLSWKMLQQHHQDNKRPTYPTSLWQTLLMFIRPLDEWWPENMEKLPAEIDPNSRLLALPLENDAALEEQVLDYLAELDLPNANSVNAIREELEQHWIRELLEWAREDPDLREKDYRSVRMFLIEHPYANEQTFRSDLNLIYYKGRQIEDFYEQTEPIKHELLYKSSFWECFNCQGLLRWTVDGQPYCAKRSCGRIDPDYQNRRAIEPSSATCFLKTSFHQRVCLPGQAELRLYKALEHLALQVALWPGVDRYDLAVVFPNGEQQTRWAVDVKDYASAAGLARHIRANPFKRFDYDLALTWDKAFYVVPHYREWLAPGYVNQLKQRLQGEIPDDVDILDEQQFLRAVQAQLGAR